MKRSFIDDGKMVAGVLEILNEGRYAQPNKHKTFTTRSISMYLISMTQTQKISSIPMPIEGALITQKSKKYYSAMRLSH